MKNLGLGHSKSREIRMSSFFSYSGELGVSIAFSHPALRRMPNFGCAKIPKFYKGPSYKPLAPPWDLIKAYKEGRIDEDEYTRIYKSSILGKLDPEKVYNELFAIHGENPVLLCWERGASQSDASSAARKPRGDFCHRQIVGEWLIEELGLEVCVG